MVMKAQLLLAPLLVLVHLALGNPDYIVCSGYVNTLSDSQNAHFDLSQIKISLYYDGILKDTTTCNPDGSYMLSIDERQKKPFKLVPEGPTAAVFDPPYKVIDPAKNISLCKANIIFVFLGFTFPGQVKSKYSSMGPAGFPVELCLPNGTPVKSTVTEASGHYKFANVYPGDYLVRAAPSAPFAVDHSAASFPCKVTWSSADACSKKNIVVSGYYIKGRVEKPLAGVVLGVYCMTETLAREYHQSEAQKFAKDMPAVDGFHLMAASQINSVVPPIPAYRTHRVTSSFPTFLPVNTSWCQSSSQTRDTS